MTKPFSSADFPDVFYFLTTTICKTSCKRRRILPTVGKLTSWMIYHLNFLIASGLTTVPVWSPAEHSISDTERQNASWSAGREQRCRAQLMGRWQLIRGLFWSEDLPVHWCFFQGAFAAPCIERRTCSKTGWDLLWPCSLTRRAESGLGQISLSRSGVGGRQEEYFPITIPSLCKGLSPCGAHAKGMTGPCPGFLCWHTLF